MTIEKFIRGFEADINVSHGFVGRLDQSMYPNLAGELSEYINLISTRKTTSAAVLNQLNNIYA